MSKTRAEARASNRRRGRNASPAARSVPPRNAVPKDFETLTRVLQAQLSAMSAGHARIAQQVLSDPEGCAFMTISELAAIVGVNESTVVRFAAKLGLSGYPALTSLCRERLKEQAQMVKRFERFQELARRDGDLDSTESTGRAGQLPAPLESLAISDQRNIMRTFARVNRKDWQRAVDACAQSKAVYVMGRRKCYAVAYLLSYLLGLVRDDVRHAASEAGTLPDLLRHVGAEDAFVAISIHRYTRETVQALEFAQGRGAFTIAFTDNPASPLAHHAQIVFYVDTSSVSVLRSVSSFVSLVQALAAAVGARRGTGARSSLLIEEDVLSKFGVYVEDPGGRVRT